MEYIGRSVAPAVDADLIRALQESEDPYLTLDALMPYATRNVAFLDEVARPHILETPSSSAFIAVPLLVQLVRDWSAAGERARASTYSVVLQALVRQLASDGRALRILVPGSGLGRLAYMLAAHFRGSEIVAVDPDVNAQIMAGHLLSSSRDGSCCGDDGDCESAAAVATTADGHSAACASDSSTTLIYPSLHVANNWERTAHRLAPVAVPDVPPGTRWQVQQESNVTLVVGRFPDAAEAAGAGGATGRFDAAATCFVLDVLPGLPHALAVLHERLLPSRGVWANIGPLAYPQDDEGAQPMSRRAAAGDTAAQPTILSAAQVLGLVRRAGFQILEEAIRPDCEYTTLPHQLVRTLRQCLFFVARAVPQPAA